MSLPEVNVSPVPVSMMTRIAGSSSADSNAATTPSYIARVSAFFFSGRLNRISMMPAARVTISSSVMRVSAIISRRVMPLPQELEELYPFAQPTLHHLRATHHLAHDRGDLRRAEIEPFVKRFHVVEDFGVRQMRVAQRRDLDSGVVDQLGVFRVQPAILHRLLVKE